MLDFFHQVLNQIPDICGKSGFKNLLLCSLYQNPVNLKMFKSTIDFQSSWDANLSSSRNAYKKSSSSFQWTDVKSQKFSSFGKHWFHTLRWNLDSLENQLIANILNVFSAFQVMILHKSWLDFSIEVVNLNFSLFCGPLDLKLKMFSTMLESWYSGKAKNFLLLIKIYNRTQIFPLLPAWPNSSRTKSKCLHIFSRRIKPKKYHYRSRIGVVVDSLS